MEECFVYECCPLSLNLKLCIVEFTLALYLKDSCFVKVLLKRDVEFDSNEILQETYYFVSNFCDQTVTGVLAKILQFA